MSSSPIRITAIEWCIGCSQRFGDRQIVANRQQFADMEAKDTRQSVAFIHAQCIKTMEDKYPGMKVPDGGVWVFGVPDGDKEGTNGAAT